MKRYGDTIGSTQWMTEQTADLWIAEVASRRIHLGNDWESPIDYCILLRQLIPGAATQTGAAPAMQRHCGRHREYYSLLE